MRISQIEWNGYIKGAKATGWKQAINQLAVAYPDRFAAFCKPNPAHKQTDTLFKTHPYNKVLDKANYTISSVTTTSFHKLEDSQISDGTVLRLPKKFNITFATFDSPRQDLLKLAGRTIKSIGSPQKNSLLRPSMIL